VPLSAIRTCVSSFTASGAAGLADKALDADAHAGLGMTTAAAGEIVMQLGGRPRVGHADSVKRHRVAASEKALRDPPGALVDVGAAEADAQERRVVRDLFHRHRMVPALPVCHHRMADRLLETGKAPAAADASSLAPSSRPSRATPC
jgi:hypothetical protein